MEIYIVTAACILYNGIYLAYLIKNRRIRAAIGTSALLMIVAAGFILLMIGKR